jgi:hypothetical protein
VVLEHGEMIALVTTKRVKLGVVRDKTHVGDHHKNDDEHSTASIGDAILIRQHSDWLNRPDTPLGHARI